MRADEFLQKVAGTHLLLLLFSPGIGYASIVIVSLLNVYYIVILAWGVYYLFQVGSEPLPR